jgi:tetratricopeptide (TPR) repeat protein
VRLGEIDRAEAIYRNTLKADPAAVDVAVRLLAMLEEQKRFQEARELLGQIDVSPTLATGMRLLAAIGERDRSKQIDELALGARRDPKDFAGRLLLARLVYAQNKDSEQAFKLLAEAQAITPDSLEPTIIRVDILNAENRREEARRIVDAEVEARKSFAAHLLRGGFLMSVGDMAAAEKDFLQGVALGQDGAGYGPAADFYIRTNQIDKAVAIMEKGSQAFPGNSAIKEKLARLLMDHSDPASRDRGEGLLAELLKDRPEDIGLLLARASVLMRKNTRESIDQARKTLADVVTMDPRAADAHLMLIQSALQREGAQVAGDLADRALKSSPRSVPLLLAKAQVELELGNYSAAQGLAQDALRQDPLNPDAHVAIIKAARPSKPKAIQSEQNPAIQSEQKLLEQLVADNPANFRLRLLHGAVLDALGRTDDAIADLEAFGKTDAGKDNVAVLLGLAEMYRLKADLPAAERCLARAEAIAPESLDVVAERVVLLGGRKDYDGILSLLRGRQKPTAEDAPVLDVACRMLVGATDPKYCRDALRIFEDVARLSPASAPVKVRLASLAYQAGELDRALQVYGEALDLAPNNVAGLNDKAWILAKDLQQYDAAIKLADKGVSLDPRYRHLRDTRGYILERLGRLKEARNDYDECAKLTELIDDPGARARALAAGGRISVKLSEPKEARERFEKEARERFEKALQLDGKHNVFTAEERSEIQQELRKVSGGGAPTSATSG